MEKWGLIIIPILIGMIGFRIIKLIVKAFNKRNKSQDSKTIHWDK